MHALQTHESAPAGMNQMILDLVLNFHAWSTARPEFETAHAGDTLMDEAQRVLATEREQGMSLFSFGMNCIVVRLRPLSAACVFTLLFHPTNGYLTHSRLI